MEAQTTADFDLRSGSVEIQQASFESFYKPVINIKKITEHRSWSEISVARLVVDPNLNHPYTVCQRDLISCLQNKITPRKLL